MTNRNWIIIVVDSGLSIKNNKGERFQFSTKEIAEEVARQMVDGDFIIFNISNS